MKPLVPGRCYRRTAMLVVAATALIGVPANPAAAESYVPISGAGSTWSQNALEQWSRNVGQYGMKVNYQGTGSSDGRNQFRNGTVDFAVSEIPYGLKDGGVVDNPPPRGHAYMPIVAGGTALMYNLKIGGKRVTNLRLSGETLAKIFTGVVTSWDAAEVKADNPGLSLPARKVVPVVRSDGSGTTAQFTTWLSKQHTALWDSYCEKAGRSTPCGVTSNYPVVNGSGFTAQAGSLGVSGYVAQSQNEGTITYVEYSYAVNTGFPVVKMLNRAGYYAEPTASNVAVALLEARINTDESSPNYLTQILDGVYANPDKRTYILSSYSYMVIPTKVEGSFSEDKGKTLGAFGYYFLCGGQQQAPALGYSPLPINLVRAGLDQVKRIPGVDVQNVDITKCDNPTFSKDGSNTLAKNAPQPQECDRKGSTSQCGTGTGGAKAPTRVSGGSTSTASTGTGRPTASGTTPAATSGAPTAGGVAAGAPLGTSTIAEGAIALPVVDPDTGQVLAAAGDDSGVLSGGGEVVAQPVALGTAAGPGLGVGVVFLTVLLLVAVTVAPPLVHQSLDRRAGQ